MRENETTIPSFGLHPWDVGPSPQQLAEQLTVLERQIMEYLKEKEKQQGQQRKPFIGECGLDRICDAAYDLQIEAFKAQIELSERLSLPIILHCVRSLDDVLRLKQGTHQPWVWHGFRGKPQQLKQLLDHGFYVSFGFRHNPDSLLSCPSDRLFLETDDTPQPIVPLYANVAQRRHTTSEALNKQLWQNLAALM